MTTHLDPIQLAHAQLEADIRATARFPDLLQRKIARMTISSIAFLRGSAELFYHVLTVRPDLARGPKGKGWIAGDLHLENFGAYRTDGHSPKSRVVFGMNDFDEAIIAPWRIDVLRLTTSLLLAARGFGLSGKDSTELGFMLLRGYARASFRKKANTKTPIRTPRVVQMLVDQVRVRTRLELLNARTEIRHGKRTFIRGLRYRSISSELARKAQKAFAQYLATHEMANPAEKKHFEVIDAAQRIAGTGSLGCLRIALLTKGKGGRDDAFVFDMKEEKRSAASRFGKAPRGESAARVIEAMRSSLPHPPRMLGSTRIGTTSMLVRRLAPQEDKLDLSKASIADLGAVAAFVGACAGDSHARGATRPPKKQWTDTECEELLDHAIDLAGIHEAVYLAYSRITAKMAVKR
ncbi:MAG: DUF2252 family protein [Polyangiaceae bacterium]